VNPSGILRTLLERRLVKIVGRKKVVGKPFLYGTTPEFLLHFGLNTLDDLPAMEEFTDLLDVAPPAAGDPALPAAGEIRPRRSRRRRIEPRARVGERAPDSGRTRRRNDGAPSRPRGRDRALRAGETDRGARARAGAAELDQARLEREPPRRLARRDRGVPLRRGQASSLSRRRGVPSPREAGAAPPRADEQVVLGNGSTELIELFARTFLGADGWAVMSDQAFIMYGSP